MAWLTPPIFKPGDAEADIAATILGGGRSSRLYKKLVYEKQIAQNVTAQQQSLILGSIFQIRRPRGPATPPRSSRRRSTRSWPRLRTQPPTRAKIERARNTIETHIIGGLERLGGFGGIADRLNCYNHYLATPDYLAAGHRALSRRDAGAVQAFAREQLTPTPRRRARRAGYSRLGAAVPTPPPAQAAARQGGASRSTPTSRGARSCRSRARRAPLQLADAGVARRCRTGSR